ncbi:MAG: DUF3037 domain-containing protein [Bryobacterales bacterium]|nr:DUF3037 domain-containing protein [Bryobacterales bacterium]
MNQAQRGYYSLVQFCPDDSRLEAVNVGLAVFLPDVPRVLVRWAATAKARISNCFGPQDWGLLDNQRNAIGARLSEATGFLTREAIDHFAATRASSVRLTPARPLKFTRPVDVEFDSLFHRLVHDRPRSSRAHAVTANLRSALKQQGVTRLLERQVTVTVPKLHRQIKAPYGYQNGRFNLILPEQFALSTDEQVLTKASRIAVEGQYLYEAPDPQRHELQLVLVANFAPAQQQQLDAVQDIMARHRVHMYTFENLTPLVTDIRSSAVKHGIDTVPLPDLK